MINIMRYLLLLLIVINLAGCGKYVSVYFKAVDEDGTPVVKANVGVGYSHGYTWTSSGKVYEKTGITNETGIYHYTAHVPYRENVIPKEIEDVFAAFKKEGYYRSYAQYIKDKDIDAGRWHAEIDPMIILMRKKLKPVPMYARDTRMPHRSMVIPVLDKEVGFDLIEYDWMPPYGKGQTTDFILKAERTFVNNRDFDSTVTITFPNECDGIQLHRENRESGSDFKLPRFAPDSGYSSKLIIKMTMDPKKGIIGAADENNNYFFRVRSEKKDSHVRSMYGKIHGNIDIEPRGSNTVVIIMRYYLNPDYTRNMEFGSNIFKGLNIGLD